MFDFAGAEALAQEARERALSLGFLPPVVSAGEAIQQSRARGRRKYEALGLVTRGRALAAVGRTREAIGQSRRALRLARQLGDPALLVRAAGLLLEIDGDAALAAEVREAIARISSALPDPQLCACLEAAEPVRELWHRLGTHWGRSEARTR